MSDTTMRLFESNALLPEQFFSASGRAYQSSNERQLMRAILNDAVECFQKFALARSAQGRDLFDEADQWIFSNERQWPFSFENICDVLGIDYTYIRNGLAPLRSKATRQVRKTPTIVPISSRQRAQLEQLEPFEELGQFEKFGQLESDRTDARTLVDEMIVLPKAS